MVKRHFTLCFSELENWGNWSVNCEAIVTFLKR
jgi:hypothetical protein